MRWVFQKEPVRLPPLPLLPLWLALLLPLQKPHLEMLPRQFGSKKFPKGGTEIELIRRNSDRAGALGAACVTQTQSCWLSNSELAIKNAALLPPWLRPQCRLTGRS
jgi:hypothetical protein